jgi:hypothetical protein
MKPIFASPMKRIGAICASRAASYVLTFLAMFATDAAWAAYIASVKAGSALEAAAWALGLFLFGAFAVLGYTRNRWLVIPAALGAFAGTFCGVLMQAV